MGMGSALYMMRFIQPLYNELRKYILAYQFADETEEISFFKEYKPEVLSKYLYYNKIYVIESKYPTGSDVAQREYLYKEFPRISFMSLWSKINGIDSWIANPWVWVYEFKIL